MTVARARPRFRPSISTAPHSRRAIATPRIARKRRTPINARRYEATACCRPAPHRRTSGRSAAPCSVSLPTRTYHPDHASTGSVVGLVSLGLTPLEGPVRCISPHELTTVPRQFRIPSCEAVRPSTQQISTPRIRHTGFSWRWRSQISRLPPLQRGRPHLPPLPRRRPQTAAARRAREEGR